MTLCDTPHGVRLDRAPLLANRALTGVAWCEAYTGLVDEWLAALLGAAGPPASGVSLVAIGGYGRSELCPSSDIDVMLLRDKRADVRAIADRVWYPIWDEGLKLGHSVCTVREALSLASEDLDTATAVLSARHVAGDELLTSELAKRAQEQWSNKASRWLGELATRVESRHHEAGEVAFRLEPDLKDGRGGMRDVHALQWAEAARRVLLHHDDRELEHAYAVLLEARVELHRHTGRSTNMLMLQDQAAVAEALGDASAETLMKRVAAAARSIAWTSDDAWRRVKSGLTGPSGRGVGRGQTVAPGVALLDGEVHLDENADPADPDLALRVALAAATHDAAIERATLERLAAETVSPPEPWPAATCTLFVELLLCGRGAISVIEALDQRGIWTYLLPEWASVRARPQRNPYHRFTVDRHLLETVVNAANRADLVLRPDLLVLAALLHDLGKGQPGDHTAAGMALAEGIGRRIGLDDHDIEVLVSLVEHHLLLSDVATRRDLDDPATVDRVVAAVGSVERLRLLAALTESDGRATGPAAWGAWKAELVNALIVRVARRLGTDLPGPAMVEEFPSAKELERLESGQQRFDVYRDELTVMTADRPGVFSRVAGVLALRGLDVLHAMAYSSETGRALARFRVTDPFRDETPWDRVIADLELALDGRLALNARLSERAAAHDGRRQSRLPARAASVAFDNDASADATVIDVEAPDVTGILFRVTRALAELELDIRSAKVQTLGTHVVDAFYVRDRDGRKVTDSRTLGEIERAILHGIAEASLYSSK
ncbi:MAG: [protein-PII] uridylyltransferase [Acidimicrobiaceae bacterium]|jgi:[protein-PII] uridylyltransferase